MKKEAKIDLDDENESFVSKSALTPANYAVINVFKRYIQIGDPQILIPTALEFIHCIVHYLQSTEGFEQCKYFRVLLEFVSSASQSRFYAIK